MSISMITDNELNDLESTRSEAEWNKVCDRIKAARGGQYPEDWWAKVQMTGLAHRVQANWKR